VTILGLVRLRSDYIAQEAPEWPVTAHDWARAAPRRSSIRALRLIAGGAGAEEETVRANLAAFRHWRIRPAPCDRHVTRDLTFVCRLRSPAPFLRGPARRLSIATKEEAGSAWPRASPLLMAMPFVLSSAATNPIRSRTFGRREDQRAALVPAIRVSDREICAEFHKRAEDRRLRARSVVHDRHDERLGGARATFVNAYLRSERARAGAAVNSPTRFFLSRHCEAAGEDMLDRCRDGCCDVPEYAPTGTTTPSGLRAQTAGDHRQRLSDSGRRVLERTTRRRGDRLRITAGARSTAAVAALDAFVECGRPPGAVVLMDVGIEALADVLEGGWRSAAEPVLLGGRRVRERRSGGQVAGRGADQNSDGGDRQTSRLRAAPLGSRLDRSWLTQGVVVSPRATPRGSRRSVFEQTGQGGEVLVRIEATRRVSQRLHVSRRTAGKTVSDPARAGHEGEGTIEAVGDGVTSLASGPVGRWKTACGAVCEASGDEPRHETAAC